MGTCSSKKSNYVLQVRPARQSLTDTIKAFGVPESPRTELTPRQRRRASRRASGKRLMAASMASRGKITARAGSIGGGTIATARATVWRTSSFDMQQVIGTGVHAKVYLAKAKKSHHFYALKQFNKSRMASKNRVKYMEDEMRSLLALSSPFIVNMLGSFQDDRHVYFVLDYHGGGELFSRMHRKRMSEEEAKFYLAEVLLALQAIHEHSMIYRDLKPENIVLTAAGHACLVDFGFCKETNDSGYLFNKVGTAHYLAPELLDKKVNKRGYTRAVDFWAFGCLMYEMLAGKAAFGKADDNPFAIYTRIIRNKLSMPRGASKAAKSLLKLLLHPDPTARASSAYIVKHHEFFAGVDWEAVAQRRLVPPFNPNLGHLGDAQHFDNYSVSDAARERKLSSSQASLFDAF